MGFSKRLICLALCLALCLVILLSSISCAESDNTSTAPETSTPIKEIEPAVDNYFTVHEDLTALPIASGDMSVDELRSLCVEFARLQGSFLWRPSREIKYYNWNAGDIRLLDSRLYGGLPYSSAGSTIYAFLDFYDRESGVMTPRSAATSIGSSETTAVWLPSGRGRVFRTHFPSAPPAI